MFSNEAINITQMIVVTLIITISLVTIIKDFHAAEVLLGTIKKMQIMTNMKKIIDTIIKETLIL